MGGTAVVVFSRSDGPSGAAYSPVVEGDILTFLLADGRIRDEQTGSEWNMAGQATDGPLAGTQLTPFPTRTSLWVALIAAYPDLILR